MNSQASIQRSHTQTVMGKNVPLQLQHWAGKTPEKPFLVWEPFEGEHRTWTYSEFNDVVDRVAGNLMRKGVRAGNKLLIHMDNCPEFLISWFACARLGAVAVTTNTRSVARDMAYFANMVEPVGVITQPQFIDLISENVPQRTFIALTDAQDHMPGEGVMPFSELTKEHGEDLNHNPDYSDDLSIQFTSGTTSRPKAVLWTHGNAIWGGQVNSQHMQLVQSDIALTFLPLFHTNSLSYSVFSTLWTGATLVLQPRFSSSRFWEVAIRNRCTWSSMVRFCARAIGKLDHPGEHSFRFWAPVCRFPDIEEKLGIHTFGWWAMTETVSQGISGSPGNAGPATCIGRPSSSYDISIRRPDGSEIGPGERGRLYVRGVRGVSLFKEYYRNPEATAEAFDDEGWFDTGDLIAMDESGDLYFSDRDKDMVKVGGENVSASEIEVILNQSGHISESAVVAQNHYMLDQVPVAFVIPNADAPDELAEILLTKCRTDLADFKVPYAIHVVDELPRGTLEKIDKKELRARLPEINS